MEMHDGFPMRLKEARKNKELSVLKLAKISGLSNVTIHKLEKGDYLPYLMTAFLLAKALDVSIDYLAKGENNRENI